MVCRLDAHEKLFENNNIYITTTPLPGVTVTGAHAVFYKAVQIKLGRNPFATLRRGAGHIPFDD